MGLEDSEFDSVLIAALAGVIGGAYLVGAMVALMANSTESALLLGESIGVATAVGVLLLLTAGALAASQRWARFLGVLSFGPVIVFGHPTGALEPIPVFQTVVAAVSAVYLTLRNPVKRRDRSNVDDSDSASKVGSTMR